MRILVVDDSIVFRSQIKAALETHPNIKVVGTAANGKIALDKLEQLSVDLITLDLEMPEMNGIETLKELRKRRNLTCVIVFSSKSKKGSDATLDALRNGAEDFVTKPSGQGLSIENAANAIRADLLPKVIQFFPKIQNRKNPILRRNKSTVATQKIKTDFNRKIISTFNPNIVIIGSSTGGPVALEKIFQGIKGPFKCPVLICQHMPPIFTASLAKRLNQVTEVDSFEAKNMEELKNQIYVAPGDYHMTLLQIGSTMKLKLDQKAQRNCVRPAVDYLFESVAPIFNSKCMGFILTGMGEDGALGCIEIKKNNGGVMIQNEESCVVFGMPGAVHANGAFDETGDLSAINTHLKRMVTK